MFSILVVDDEEWIREGIMVKLKKDKLQFKNIYGAGSGEEALEIIRNNEIDIVITDICMNNMNGLDLVAKIKEINNGIEFIIVSGYSEFKYAERAINMGVKGYLLKPSTNEDLYNALNKAINSINERKEHSLLFEENEKNKIYSERLILENELNKQLNTKQNSKSYLSKIKHDMMADCNRYKLLAISFDGLPAAGNANTYDEVSSLKTNFTELLSDAVYDENYFIFSNFNVSNQLFILLWGNEEKLEHLSDMISKKSLYSIANEMDIVITIGISSVMDKIDDDLRKSAKKSLDLKLIYGTKKIYRDSDINKFSDFVFPRSELRMLSGFIEKKDLKNIRSILLKIFSKERFDGVNINNLYFMYSEVVNVIYGSLYSINREFTENIEYDLSQYGIIKGTNELVDIAKYLYKLIESAININPSGNPSCKEIVDKVVKYIDVHYVERINLKALADKFGIDANYFSTIFKKDLGVTFTTYLAMQRLNKACQILRETNINVQEIAESIGYSDIQYFYRVFKKEYGITPMEYRKNNQRQNSEALS